jgi:hypothetical protein
MTDAGKSIKLKAFGLMVQVKLPVVTIPELLDSVGADAK